VPSRGVRLGCHIPPKARLLVLRHIDHGRRVTQWTCTDGRNWGRCRGRRVLGDQLCQARIRSRTGRSPQRSGAERADTSLRGRDAECPSNGPLVWQERDDPSLHSREEAPLTFLLILVAEIVLAMVVLYLIAIVYARRAAQRMRAILDRLNEGDLQGAKDLTAQWDRGDRPKNPLTRIRLAAAWSTVGDHERALAVLDGTKVPGGLGGRPLRRMASGLRYTTLKALGEEERAAWFLRDAMMEDPRAPWVLTATSTDPGTSERQTKNPQALATLIQDAVKNHRFEEAVEMHERFLRRMARDPGARPVLGHAYALHATYQLAAHRDAAAEVSFQEFLKRSPDPDRAENRVMKGRADGFLLGGRISEASSAYEALATEGKREAYFGLAMCRLRQGQAERAERDLDRAEELGYPKEKARFVRAQILADLGRDMEAVTLAREAASERPSSDPSAVYTLAYVLATAQQPDAEAALRKYVELYPNDPDLGRLLDRPVPSGGTWRERLKAPPRPDLPHSNA
jgi:tetratricopeptide (TPR) repeat protein